MDVFSRQDTQWFCGQFGTCLFQPVLVINICSYSMFTKGN